MLDSTPTTQCSCVLCVVDQDLSHMGDDEAYDYKFVKWMIKEKVSSMSSFDLLPTIYST